MNINGNHLLNCLHSIYGWGNWGLEGENAEGVLAVVVGALNRVVSRSMTFALLLAFSPLIVFSP